MHMLVGLGNRGCFAIRSLVLLNQGNGVLWLLPDLASAIYTRGEYFLTRNALQEINVVISL